MPQDQKRKSWSVFGREWAIFVKSHQPQEQYDILVDLVRRAEQVYKEDQSAIVAIQRPDGLFYELDPNSGRYFRWTEHGVQEYNSKGPYVKDYFPKGVRFSHSVLDLFVSTVT
ncbi:hypothetical protein JCM3765_005545 [Sporobolomyces pararoseus]